MLDYLFDNFVRTQGSERWRQVLGGFRLKYPDVDFCFRHLSNEQGRVNKVPRGYLVWRVGRREKGCDWPFDHYPIPPDTYVVQLFPTRHGAAEECLRRRTMSGPGRVRFATNAAEAMDDMVITGSGLQYFDYDAQAGELTRFTGFICFVLEEDRPRYHNPARGK